MAWEKRGRRFYYYSAERVGGKVVKTYLGRGETAQLIGLCVAGRRLERRLDRSGAARQMPAAVLAAVDEVDALASALARSALLLAGFRRHKRGEWRRQRRQPKSRDEGKGGEPR